MPCRSAHPPSPQARRILISVSPHAGPRSPRERAQAIAAELTSAGYGVQVSECLDELAELAAQTSDQAELRCVLACGGDGTAAVIRNRVPLEIPLLLVPMGTENLLGRYVRQSPEPSAVRATVEHGVSIGFDLGLVRDHTGNQRYFLMMISAGFDAEVVRLVHERRRGHITRGTYLQPMLEMIRSYAYPEMQLYCGDGRTSPPEPIRCRWLFGFNLPLYAHGWRMAPDATGTDGLLDVCTFRGGSVFHGAKYLWHVMRGSHLSLADAGLVRGEKLRIEPTGSAEIAYQTDGDFGGTLPVGVEILPEQLRLLVMPDTAQQLGFQT